MVILNYLFININIFIEEKVHKFVCKSGKMYLLVIPFKKNQPIIYYSQPTLHI